MEKVFLVSESRDGFEYSNGGILAAFSTRQDADIFKSKLESADKHNELIKSYIFGDIPNYTQYQITAIDLGDNSEEMVAQHVQSKISDVDVFASVLGYIVEALIEKVFVLEISNSWLDFFDTSAELGEAHKGARSVITLDKPRIAFVVFDFDQEIAFNGVSYDPDHAYAGRFVALRLTAPYEDAPLEAWEWSQVDVSFATMEEAKDAVTHEVALLLAQAAQ